MFVDIYLNICLLTLKTLFSISSVISFLLQDMVSDFPITFKICVIVYRDMCIT